MFGLVGTVLVITQMALMALGYEVTLAMAAGLIAAICWMFHAIKRRDSWLLYVNASVFGFALYGLTIGA